MTMVCVGAYREKLVFMFFVSGLGRKVLLPLVGSSRVETKAPVSQNLTFGKRANNSKRIVRCVFFHGLLTRSV